MYEVYAQISSSNLNPALADELVEEGILKVQLEVTPEVFYTPS